MLAVSSSIYSCYYPTCQKTFATKFNLRRHVNSSHLAIKNYTCPICLKKFASKQNLSEHHYIHTGEKPFQCTVSTCGRKFRQASQLCIHKKTHLSSETPSSPPSYFCDIKLTDMMNFVPKTVYTAVGGPTVLIPKIRGETSQRGEKLPVVPALINQTIV